MLNELLLLSGNDIPFSKARLTVHPPTIKEIAYIGEENFFIGCQLLNFSKDLLADEDKVRLEDTSNFEIFMSIMKDKQDVQMQKNKISAFMVLSLMFPDYHFSFGDKSINFVKEGDEQNTGLITEDNFDEFQQILVDMFCLRSKEDDLLNYNPKGAMAAKLAEKMKRGRQIAAEQKNHGKQDKVAVFSRYVSVLSIGESKTMDKLLNYTVYQLCDEFERFELKQNYDIYIQAKLAGAKDMKEPDDWTKDIH